MTALNQLLEHLAKQNKLNPTASNLVKYLYKKRNNRDVFPWTSKHTMEAANALDITHESIKKAMVQLVQANLITKTDRATYQYSLPDFKNINIKLTYEFVENSDELKMQLTHD